MTHELQQPPAAQISIVVPVFNNASVIAELNTRFAELLPRYFESPEILYVDDGSTDDTVNKLINLNMKSPYPVSIIRLKKNYGQHFATLCGIFFSRGFEIITIDADMAEEVCHIPGLIYQRKETNADVVYAAFDRLIRYGYGWKYVFSRLFLSVARVFGLKHYSSFRAISCRVKQKIMVQRHRHFVIEGMLIESGCALAYYFPKTFPEKGNASAYTFIKRCIFTISLFVEYKPLFFFSALWIILNGVMLSLNKDWSVFLALNALLFCATFAYSCYRLLAPETVDQINNSVKSIRYLPLEV